jgi:uncharacterized protein YbjT (DUF2867 family)
MGRRSRRRWGEVQNAVSNVVLVAGATGSLGSRITRELRLRGARVRALVRPGASVQTRAGLATAGVEIADADLENVRSLPQALEGVTSVVSTVTAFPRDERFDAIEQVDAAGNVALIDAAEAEGVARFVFVSFKPVAIDFPLQRAKRSVEQRLRGASLDTVVLRPGKFMDIWFSPLCGFDAAGARATVFGGGTSPVTWIAAADVAEIAARSALGEGPVSGVLELGGPEALSQREVIERFEDVLGTRFALEHIASAELERRRAGASHPVDESLAALMLEAELGAVTDRAAMLAAFPLELTTVSAFAARVALSLR